MLIPTSHLPHASHLCSRELSEESRDIWASVNTAPRSQSPAKCSETDLWLPHIRPCLSGSISRLNFEAMVMMAFSGFLRCGEFMVQPGKAFYPDVNIMRSCIQFWPSLSSPLHITFTILS